MGLGQGARRDHLMPTPMAAQGARDALWAFEAYQAVRHRLPTARFPDTSRTIANLGDLADDFDVFLLDAFGVLNIGEGVVPGAPERVRALQALGKTVMVLSNSGGYPKRLLLERWDRLGYDIAPDHILCSREVLLNALRSRPARKYGLLASQRFGREELEHLDAEFLCEDAAVYDAAQEFLLFGSAEWTEPRQALLEAALRADPRPVLVANPDIVAPREGGLSKELGHFAHRLADATGIAPQFHGKPYGPIFETALAGLGPGLDRARVVMVGDTLHTDILGGAAAGVKTALITGHGSLADIDPGVAIEKSGITPDFVLPHI
jgi:HAD superfamily hydrolase (TIGR01450 family)